MASIESVTLEVADAGPFTDPDGFAWETASFEPEVTAQLHHSGM